MTSTPDRSRSLAQTFHPRKPIFPHSPSLIGREREVERLSQLLCDPQCRLLTLVGSGGVGKTRLAIETATRMPRSYGIQRDRRQRASLPFSVSVTL